MRRGENQNEWGKKGEGRKKGEKNTKTKVKKSEEVVRQMEKEGQRKQLNQTLHPLIS